MSLKTLTAAQQSMDISRFLKDVLPITGFEKLLRSMVSAWAELSSAQSVHLAGFDSTTSMTWSVARQGTSCSAIEIIQVDEWSPSQHASKRNLAPHFVDLCGCGAAWFDSSVQLDEPSILEFADVCGGLIQQAQLAATSNRISTEDELLAAKLESLAEFAAGAGHEINNPVATIAGRAAILLKDETDPQRRQALATIGGQAYRIRDMIGDVMLFARPPSPNPEPLDLAPVISEVVQKLDELATNSGCQIIEDCSDDVSIFGDRTQLSVVISELLRNSINASQNGGSINIAATTGSSVTLSVTDHGTGFTDIELQHLFDPFFSGRQAGRGLGFGLSKCWRIIKMHGGSIEVNSEPNGSTMVTVVWPSSGKDGSLR
ncbi:MAG: hypothetical protein CMJ78_18290 [Planctomycetaceae bacterium]|nr:hypothetical protein [Planctomycetaceae bacterium]